MEGIIRQKVSELIEKCVKFEKDVLCENGDIKEEYQETILEKYLDVLTEFEMEISSEQLGIIVDEDTDIIKKFISFIMF